MLVATFLENIVDLVLKVPGFRDNERLRLAHAEWQAGTTLQLQRLAHEGLGLGAWSKTTGAVPVTRPGDVMGVLDVGNIQHPRLVAPATRMEDVVPDSYDGKDTVGSRYTRVSSSERL